MIVITIAFQKMSSETTSLLHNQTGGGAGRDQEWAQNWMRNGKQTAPRPRQSPRSEKKLTSLPPMPQSMPAPSSNGHSRSRSDFVFPPTQSDPNHPFNKGGQQRPPPSGVRNPRSSRPPSRITASPPTVPALPALPQQQHAMATSAAAKPKFHRRVKSDVPLLPNSEMKRLITKADLLKSFPNTRWGGPSVPLTASQQSHVARTSYDGGVLLLAAAAADYGSTTTGQMHPLLNPSTIGNIPIKDGAKKVTRHTRATSDVSVRSVTTNMAKSVLFRGVTEEGTLQLQLPKDNFRILMDSHLTAGCVYKRKLVDEDAEFLNYHTVEEGNPLEASSCGCTCAHCHRCHMKVKRLPPDLYVMSVDNSLYRRMLDEIIYSKTMPCGTYFCGHHEDVKHPDIKIAVAVVLIVFLLFLAGAVIIRD